MIKISQFNPNSAMKRIAMSFNPPVPLATLYDKYGSVEIPGQQFAAVKNPIPNEPGTGQITGQLFLYHEKTNSYAPVDLPIQSGVTADQQMENLAKPGAIEQLNQMGVWLVLRDDVVQVYYDLQNPSMAIGMSFFSYIPAIDQVPQSSAIPAIEIGDDGGMYAPNPAQPTTTDGYGRMSGWPGLILERPVTHLPVAPYQQAASFMPLSGCCHSYGTVGGYGSIGGYGVGFGLGNAPLPAPATASSPSGTYLGSWWSIADGIAAGAGAAGLTILGIVGVATLPVMLVLGAVGYLTYRIMSGSIGTTIATVINDVPTGIEQGYKKQTLHPNASTPQAIGWWVGRSARLIQDGIQAGINGMQSGLKMLADGMNWLKKYGTYLALGFGALAVGGLGIALYIRARQPSRRY